MISSNSSLYQLRREILAKALTSGMEGFGRTLTRLDELQPLKIFERSRIKRPASDNTANETKQRLTPEDFNPLGNECFQNPFEFYRLLRDQYPIYRLKNDVYCISRYQDIVDISRNIEVFSSQHQGLVANLKPGQSLLKQVKRFEFFSKLGVLPADVLATSDPPAHTDERKAGHSSLNARYVKSLEPEVRQLCEEMLTPLLDQGEMEFMQAFAWRLPMTLIIRLLGLPEEDFEQIKRWCVAVLDSQNGIQSGGELAQSYAATLKFLRYCWKHYLAAKANPKDNLISILVRAAQNPESLMTDEKAVSAIFQLLIAGSDSSATTMGNAIKLLIEHPDIETRLRAEPELISPFIEEVFRLESAFQGHFRWNREAVELHGQPIPPGSRIFLLWASGNRDERFWENPNELLLNRPNGKKHLTFGHGIHACIGRELARMEIRIVIEMLLARTSKIQLNGDTPFVASMFARTLLTLPIKAVKAK